MPCNAAPHPEFSRHDMEAVEIYFQAEIDRVTKVACEAIKMLKRNALFDGLSEEARAWSHEHDAWDAARTLVEKSIKATVRRSTFDDKGDEIDYLDGRQALADDDISDLRLNEIGERVGYGADKELSHQVYEDSFTEYLAVKEDRDEIVEEELQGETFLNNVRAQEDEAEEPEA
jgi:hypothetical protein